jgi:hypothetical protein
MLKLFIAAISVGLIYWVWLTKKKTINFPIAIISIDPFITTIEAIEIQTFLDWNTPQYCLECDGIRYGKQFKQKKAPDLPHEAGCRCEAIKLFYTSDDVFQGTSPVLTHKSALGDLSTKDALLLKNILLKIRTSSGKGKFSDFLEQYEINNFSENIRSRAISLAEHAFEAKQNKK